MRRIITLIVFILSSALLGYSQNQELDSLSIQLAFETQDSIKVETSLKIIKLLYESKEYNKAIKYIIESEKLSNNITFEKGIATTAYYKSKIYADKGDYINAINGFKKAKSIYQTLNDTTGVAVVNNSIGLLEINRGNFAEGLQYALAATRDLEQLNLKKELAQAYCNLAEAYLNIGASDYAIQFNLKSLDVLEQLNDPLKILTTKIKLAELYSKNKEYRKSIEFYESVLNQSSPNSDSIKGIIYPKIGREYLKFNDFDKATKYLLDGLKLNRSSNDKAGLLLALNGLGALNIQLKQFNLAEQQLYEAGNLAKSTDNKQELLTYYKYMKVLDSTKRKFDKAFVWQREYYNLKNQLSAANATNTVKLKPSDLEFNPNFDKTEPTLEQTEEIVHPTPLMIQSDNKFKIVLYGLLAALAIVSTFLILIYMKRNSNIKYTQELEEKNIKIQLQNEAFAEQTQHLENVNNVKDKLFSIISHDLKDSLSSINGFINLLREGSLSREEFDNLVPELSENANNASLLLFNLLNWSKSQMQSLDPKPSLFDIQEVFEEKVKLIEQRMESKGITLVDHSLRDFAYADKSMIEIVIQNLLANALKFCKNGDTITISNHISNGSCIISVADTGIGISEENMSKLFKNSSFTTLGTNNEKGTGLGLSICKELVELNNGKIWVESTVNVGTTFYVQLPKSKPNN
ncbi:tetratricopeptide repeat-containing sensor histidine kinase [Aestuariibaculum sediminum]|uniref:histidine kinase n=1 Tax=Aestuariibaculum sediminum TaxID=2770637 RepID=A0A8J6Q976_9FLAO|nr:tetratricopeptide repeat-containing sensor histidine kinase [Aestuariibaculum sediminum]MBD0830661.1 tetratricopeptide repeat-containing sensor histidine kinase [Aestuariibaculum sediminum]